MDTRAYIQQQFTSMRHLRDAALKDTTEEQLNWMPPGTANPIRAIFVHVLASEDRFVQMIIQAKPMIWETSGWSERIGLPLPPGRGMGWDEARSTALALAPVLDYQQAVYAATEAYLANLAAEDLDRRVSFIGGEQPVAQILTMLVVHTMYHAGEIAALKGLQGAKGLPF